MGVGLSLYTFKRQQTPMFSMLTSDSRVERIQPQKTLHDKSPTEI